MELQLVNSGNSQQLNRYQYQALVDLSHLPNLRSIKFICFDFTDGLLVGFDQLNNLSHLFIENCQLSEKHQDDLSNIETLEYLTVRNFQSHDKDNWTYVFESNKKLKYVEISHVEINPLMPGSSSNILQHLKYLRINDVEWDDFFKIAGYGLSHLEYLDCRRSRYFCDNNLCDIVKASPRLKFLDARGCQIRSNIVTLIRSMRIKQSNRVLLKLFVGDCNWYKRNFPTYCSEYFVVDKAPQEDEKMPDVNEGWFTKNCETIKKVSVELPILDDSSPIQKLPTECLHAIFSYLSLDDRLSVEEVCQDWNSIVLTIWKKQKTFDVRDLRYSEDAKKCVERCGEKLEEIYYYKDHELSVIADCCSNVKKVNIDFQDRMYYGVEPRGKDDSFDLEPTLARLNCLTHLTLQNVDKTYDFEFLEDLPDTMIEIHIFPEFKLTDAAVDVSKFVDLRALTLNNFQYKANARYASITGIERLENLKYLRLESLYIGDYFMHPLGKISNLEYLSLKNTKSFRDADMVGILEKNKNLKYLNLLGFSYLTNPVLNAISNLPNLQTLCLDNQEDSAFDANFDLDDDDDDEEDEEEYDDDDDDDGKDDDDDDENEDEDDRYFD